MNESWKETIVTIVRPVRIAVVTVLAILALFLLVKTGDALSRFGLGDMAPVNTITVTATGKAAAAPTVGQISFTVTETAEVVKDAQDAATTKTNAALAALKEVDIKEADITTSGYSVYPQHENQQPCYPGVICNRGEAKITGYQVSQTIEVKIRDLERIGETLGKIGSAGVQTISGPNFSFDDDSGVKEEARAGAIKDAREKARVLAKQLGVSLGPIVNFSENGAGYPIPYFAKGGDMMALSSAEVAPTLPVGEQETAVTVSITYEIR